MLLETLKTTVRSQELLHRGDRVLVGVSGGPDSLALLHALHRLVPEFGWQVFAVHVDHQLRGKASAEDAEFVEQICAEWGIPCRVIRVDVAGHLRLHGGNKQDVARKLRYQAFRQAADQWDVDALALAHHADDQVETILMRLLRGTGVSGLAGMPYIRPWEGRRLIRPLLDVYRKEIEAYCEEHALSPRLDESNRSDVYTRNRVRWKLIPELQQYNPRVKEALLQLSRVVGAEEDWWREQVDRAWSRVVRKKGKNEIVLDRNRLLDLHVALQRRVIKLILNCLLEEEANEATMDTVEQIRHLAAHPEPSARIDLPGHFRAERQYDLLMIAVGNDVPVEPLAPVRLHVPGETMIPGLSGRFVCRVTDKRLDAEYLRGVWAVFDADALTLPLWVRTRRPGDRIRPIGLNGTTKVKDLLISSKIPRRERDRLPIVLHGETIVWIPGVRRSDWAPVTANTRRFLYLEWLTDGMPERLPHQQHT
jgi:tRNA(Ile)-lysidine synthase